MRDVKRARSSFLPTWFSRLDIHLARTWPGNAVNLPVFGWCVASCPRRISAQWSRLPKSNCAAAEAICVTDTTASRIWLKAVSVGCSPTAQPAAADSAADHIGAVVVALVIAVAIAVLFSCRKLFPAFLYFS